MKNDILKKMMLCFCCLLLCFNLTTKRVKADSPSLSSNLKYWVVCVVLALAGGVKVGSDLTEAQLAKFKDKAVSYYKDLADNFGDRLSGMFTWSNALAVIAGTATQLVTGSSVKAGISMKWINNNLSSLKKLADKWITDLTSDTTFNPGSTGISIVNGTEFINWVGNKNGLNYVDYVSTFAGWSLVGFGTSLYADTYKYESNLDDYSNALFGYYIFRSHLDENSGKYNIFSANPSCFSFDQLRNPKLDINTIKSMLLAGSAYIQFTHIAYGDSHDLYFDIVDNKQNIISKDNSIFTIEGKDVTWDKWEKYFVMPAGVKVLLPDKTELKDIVLKDTPKALDNIKDYTDNLKNVDKLVYVKPDTLSIDKVGDKTIVSDPGVIGLPFPLPSDWTQPADKPYTGVDGKTHDPTKVLDPTKPWTDDKTKPVSIPADPTIDLPYDDVKDRADPQVLDPDITTPRDDPKDIDVPDTTVNPTDSYKDWHKIFPFCIPWDIEALLSFLVAEPKAPSYTFDLGSTITSNKQAKNISFDLSQYDDQAKIIRNLEMILFAVGLLLLTRYIIKG